MNRAKNGSPLRTVSVRLPILVHIISENLLKREAKLGYVLNVARLVVFLCASSGERRPIDILIMDEIIVIDEMLSS